jgi:hypothetical protein
MAYAVTLELLLPSIAPGDKRESVRCCKWLSSTSESSM